MIRPVVGKIAMIREHVLVQLTIDHLAKKGRDTWIMISPRLIWQRDSNSFGRSRHIIA